MLKRLLIACIFLLLLPATQTLAVGDAVSQHDYAYAMALASRRGWYDMAAQEFKRLMKHSDERTAINGQFGLAKILIFQAEKEIDPAKKTKLMDGALERIEDLVARHGDKLIAGRFDLGELQKQKANYLMRRSEKESDKASALRDEARSAFDKAIEQFKVVARKLKSATDEDNKFTYRKARYYSIESKFEKALTWKVGDDNRRSLLAGLKAEIEEFGWDNEGFVAAYFSYVILGQVHASLITKKHPKRRDVEDCFAAFDFVLGADLHPLTQRVRTTCYWRYIQTCNRFKFYDKALELLQRLTKEYPRPERLFFGKAALLESAKTYFGKRSMGQAMTMAQKIAQLGGYWGNKAKLLIGSWSAVMDVASPKTAFLISEGYYRARNWWDAVRNYQETLLAIDAMPSRIAKAEGKQKTQLVSDLSFARKNYETLSWERMAFAYRSLGLGYESYHCLKRASQLALERGDKPKAAQNAYYAFTTIKRRYYASKSPSDDQMAKATRKFFTTNFQDSVYYPGIKLSEARDLEEDKKYAEAAEAFAKIDRSTEFYEEAISRIGICWYKVAKAKLGKSKTISSEVQQAASKAIAGFDAYMKYIKENKAGSAEATAKRQELLAKVVYYRASLSDKLGKQDEVLFTLKGFEKKYLQSGGEQLVAAALWLRLKTYVLRAKKASAESGRQKDQLEQLQKADDELNLLIALTPGVRYVQYGQQQIGFSYDNISKKYKKGEPEQVKYTEKTVRYLYPWALRSPGISYDLLKYVAIKILILAGEDNTKYLSQSANLFARLLTAFPARAAKDKLAAHVAKCYLLTGRFAEAVGVLRQEYAANPKSGFALRGLGRAYFEVGAKASGSRSKLHLLILGARKEDLSLMRHVKDDRLRLYMIQRASVIFEANKRLSENKPLYEMSDKDFDKLQRKILKGTLAKQKAIFKNIVDEYYDNLITMLEGLKADFEVKAAGGAFAFDRSRYYYRTVGRKTSKLSPGWWDAKFYVIKSFLLEGLLDQERADRTDGPDQAAIQKRASQRKRHAEKLWKNVNTLYPDFSGPENKERFHKLYEEIKEALGR